MKATLHAFVAPAFDRVPQFRGNKAIRRRASISYVTEQFSSTIGDPRSAPLISVSQLASGQSARHAGLVRVARLGIGKTARHTFPARTTTLLPPSKLRDLTMSIMARQYRYPHAKAGIDSSFSLFN